MHDQYILISEIPRQLECFNKNYCFEFGESLFGLIYPGNCLTDPGFQTYTLNDAISIALNQADGAFVTFRANTYIIIKDTNCFYVFDPHSRDRTGKCSPFGSSIVLQCNSVDELTVHCNTLANSLSATRYEQFEITGVNVINANLEQLLSDTNEIGENEESVSDGIHELSQSESLASMNLRHKKKRSRDTVIRYERKRARLDKTAKKSYIDQVCKRKAKKRENEFQNYNTNEMCKQQKLNALNLKYDKKEQFKDTMKLMSKTKYETDQQHREKVKDKLKSKYEQNELYRNKVKECTKRRYKVDDINKIKKNKPRRNP